MSSLSIQSEAYDPSVYWAAPARNFKSSSRLHLQHQLWRNTTHFLLEPQIRTFIQQEKQLKIADLGCGNGVWLTDLSHELFNTDISVQLYGYDINDVNFPPQAFLPGPVQLSKLNILSKKLPDEVLNAFDVVHVRAFSSIILNNDTSTLLSAVLSLLKPGGWLQWEEMGPDFIVEPASPGLSKVSCETLARLVKAGEDIQGMKLDFIGEFGRHLGDAGFQQIRVREDAKRKQDYKGWTENFLMIWEDAAFFYPSETDNNQASITKEFWAQLFAKAVQETEQGVALHRRSVVTVVGRKPL
ncbi:hypothetical protein F5Y12DRAFT_748282 [Xylaria sp. FL1777]|nr:hypothetical protein F5Y12DRAFT_748282 [Xylaria sp. FL1777]